MKRKTAQKYTTENITQLNIFIISLLPSGDERKKGCKTNRGDKK